MAEATARPETLSVEEADTVEAVSAFHQAHHEGATAAQRGIDRATRALGRPRAVLIVLAVLAIAMAAGVWRDGATMSPILVGVEFVATVAALLVSMVILVTQTRETRLADRREQLTLELALLSDRKNAKIIALLEELRRDAPSIFDRADPESEAMSAPADLGSVADAIEGKAQR